jgi:hypothetical protein
MLAEGLAQRSTEGNAARLLDWWWQTGRGTVHPTTQTPSPSAGARQQPSSDLATIWRCPAAAHLHGSLPLTLYDAYALVPIPGREWQKDWRRWDKEALVRLCKHLLRQECGVRHEGYWCGRRGRGRRPRPHHAASRGCHWGGGWLRAWQGFQLRSASTLRSSQTTDKWRWIGCDSITLNEPREGADLPSSAPPSAIAAATSSYTMQTVVGNGGAQARGSMNQCAARCMRSRSRMSGHEKRRSGSVVYHVCVRSYK